ncbi:hypothetical protein SDC9_166731 [bioreactor metagenome]|uniref:Uncharacterized protein n=1 Tax=bioreactor metagenome TaxID=1076179 RepID=A0A645G613_9ZZZZ
MLRAALSRSGKREQFVFRAGSVKPDIGQFGLALRNRARFIEHDGIDFMRRLQRFAALHQHAQFRALSGADHDSRGGC